MGRKKNGVLTAAVLAIFVVVVAPQSPDVADAAILYAETSGIPIIAPAGMIPDLSEFAARHGPVGRLAEIALGFASALVLFKTGEKVADRYAQ